jgi:tetratricopeptide (TPR) repeat protein
VPKASNDPLPPQPSPAPEDPGSPLILIPVTAEDDARRKRRITISVWTGIVIVLAVAGLLYKRSVDPIHARESFDSGVRLLKIARYDQAILSFDRAIALQPDLVDAYLMRARSYVGVAKTEEAIRDFSRVTAMRPSDAQTFVERGFAYVELKDYQSALADASQAVSLNPRLAVAYNLRGHVVRSMGNPGKAVDDFTHAVGILPNEDNLYQRGATYQLLGEHRRAIADFDQVIAYKPGDAPAYFARSESRRAIGDLAGAKADHLHGRILDGR